MAAWIVAVGSEAALQEVVCQFSGLGESIHSFVDADPDFAVWIDKVGELVFLDDFVWDSPDWDFHEFGVGHWGVEIEIADVQVEAEGARGGEDIVHMDFESGDVGTWGTRYSGVVDEVPSHGESRALCFFLLWSQIAHKPTVCCFLVAWEVLFCDEVDGICTRESAPNSLGQSPEFVGGRNVPCGFVFRVFEELVVFEDLAGVFVLDRACEVVGGWGVSAA